MGPSSPVPWALVVLGWGEWVVAWGAVVLRAPAAGWRPFAAVAGGSGGLVAGVRGGIGRVEGPRSPPLGVGAVGSVAGEEGGLGAGGASQDHAPVGVVPLRKVGVAAGSSSTPFPP